MTTIGFGSCHKLQYIVGRDNIRNESLLSKIIDHYPSSYLWLGDSIYPSSNLSLPSLSSSYNKMSSFPPYASLLSTVNNNVHGTWDDHDYGTNDAGSELPSKSTRQSMYLDFLSVPPFDPRRNRPGVHHSSSPLPNVRAIFLDTRTFRDLHYVPSVGGIKGLPLNAVIASATRLLVRLMGMGKEYGGGVLGEEQWRWLDGELEDAVNDDKVEYTVIVSSIQVLTTNPMVESWGHFPVEKRRLMSLLKRHRPRGAVILSGDVHHGEIASVQGITEVTSSGLTHSCSGPWYGFVCDYMLRSFPEHREGIGYGVYYTGVNYGIMKVGEGGADFTLHGGDGEVVGRTRVERGRLDGNFNWEDVPETLPGKVSPTFAALVGTILLMATLIIRVALGIRRRVSGGKLKVV